MLGYACGTIRGTVLAPGGALRVTAHTARAAAPYIIFTGLAGYSLSEPRTPSELIGLGIGWLLGWLAVLGFWLTYRRIRAKGPRDDLSGNAGPWRPITAAAVQAVTFNVIPEGAGRCQAGLACRFAVVQGLQGMAA